ncbi:MFS transporter [Thiofaba sp. EF100]|uniref:MFS transporter n=1 Tax=Thiofaba sp. EF100 TaxID=3121274 RepID=UPI003221FD17
MSRLSPATAWALYDWANSAFATVVMAGFFPLFFKQFWAGSLPTPESTFWLGLTMTLASLVLILMAPMVGGLADALGWRKRILFQFTLLGAGATGALWLLPAGAWVWALILYGVASLAFMASNIAYDALLPAVAEPDQFGPVSSRGFALGYLGGGVVFALCVGMTLQPGWFGLTDATQAVSLSFLLTGLWWLLFSLPLMRRVVEHGPVSRPQVADAMRASLGQWRASWHHLRAEPRALTFLVAYWLYIDGVDTIIRMAVDYGLSIGLPSDGLILALLIVQFVGFPATLLYGKLAGRIGMARAIFAGLAAYVLILLWATRMDSALEFYLLAVGVGLVQGGVQALSRAYFARLTPPGREGEFFAFYNMLGKFAALFGPILVGALTLASSDHRIGMLAVLPLFVGGAWLLWLTERLGKCARQKEEAQ